MSASWALQTALYARLTGDATLMAMVTGVHDHVPQDATYPYVTLGEDAAEVYAGKTFDGAEHALGLHVWSRARGRRETKDILERLRVVLDGAALILDGHVLIDLRLVGAETVLERDGLTYHGVARFRAVTQRV